MRDVQDEQADEASSTFDAYLTFSRELAEWIDAITERATNDFVNPGADRLAEEIVPSVARRELAETETEFLASREGETEFFGTPSAAPSLAWRFDADLGGRVAEAASSEGDAFESQNMAPTSSAAGLGFLSVESRGSFGESPVDRLSKQRQLDIPAGEWLQELTESRSDGELFFQAFGGGRDEGPLTGWEALVVDLQAQRGRESNPSEASWPEEMGGYEELREQLVILRSWDQEGLKIRSPESWQSPATFQ